MHKNNLQVRNPYQIWETRGAITAFVGILVGICAAGGSNVNGGDMALWLRFVLVVIALVIVIGGLAVYGWAEPLRKQCDARRRHIEQQQGRHRPYRNAAEAQAGMRRHLDTALCPPRCTQH